MPTSPTIFLTLAIASLHAQDDGIPATLAYPDNNLISGTLTAFSDQREITLNSPLFSKPAKLKIDNLRSITLGTIPEKSNTDHYVTATIAPPPQRPAPGYHTRAPRLHR